MTLPTAQRWIFGIGLLAIPLSNAILGYSYTEKVTDSVLAGAWAAVPLLVLYWWAAAKGVSKTERVLVLGCVSISIAFGLVLFVGRIWNGLDTEPVTFMFPIVAPLLLFALQFVLMLLVTVADLFFSAQGARSKT